MTAIIITIWIAYRINPRAGMWVAVAWSAETLILLFFPPLILIQLAVVWGTYFLLRSSAEKSQRIDQLEQQLRDHPTDTQERLWALEATELEFISGKDHQQLLHEALNTARDHLCILSGWLSDEVVNLQLMRGLKAALERGAHVSIGYGFADSEGKHAEPRPSQRAFRNLKKLRQEAIRNRFPGRLSLARFANHEKLLVRDDDLVVCGSNDWLSNTHFRNGLRRTRGASEE